MKKKWKRVLPPAILLLVLMLRANTARVAAAQAVKQAATVVFPSLFPFCVVSRRLTRSGALCIQRGNRWSQKWFGVPAAGMGAFAMGLCGGYPIGVHTACELYRSGQLNPDETQRLFRFCNNTGPAFFFGMVGAVLFQSILPCAILYGIHILSALLTGVLLAAPAEELPKRSVTLPPVQSETLPESLRQSFVSVVQLCGFVVFFAVLLRLGLALPPICWLMEKAMIPQALFTAIISSFIDLPSGIAAMAQIGNPTVRFFLCSAGIAWGGLCVHMQAAGLWQETGLTAPGYYGSKLLQTLISLALSFPAARLLFGAAVPVWPVVLPLLSIVLKKAMVLFSSKKLCPSV